jgi:hypothetical protein
MPQTTYKTTIGKLDTFILSLLSAAHFPKSWKEAKIITLQKLDKDPKFPQNLRLISLSSRGANYSKM